MGKIDEVKEVLNTLRVAMSIMFGLIVVLTGSLVKRFDAERVDYIFLDRRVFGFCLYGHIDIYCTKNIYQNKRNKGFIMNLALIAFTAMAAGFIAVLVYTVTKLSEG